MVKNNTLFLIDPVGGAVGYRKVKLFPSGIVGGRINSIMQLVEFVKRRAFCTGSDTGRPVEFVKSVARENGTASRIVEKRKDNEY
jgi:hypothetical protein